MTNELAAIDEKIGAPALAGAEHAGRPVSLGWIVTSSTLGSVIDWYDFYLYASLAVFFGSEFFPPGNEKLGVLLSVATMGIGFAARPLGGVVFGTLGDYFGRKYAFLLTLIVMGVATTAMGLLPTYASMGVLSPILLIVIRVVQGLAVGGEVGGAATYVVENAPEKSRGFYTGLLMTSAQFGTILSLIMIVLSRHLVGEEAFKVWGWRIPFLFSVILVVFSIFLRMRLQETPIYTALKAAGRTTKTPLRDVFLDKTNLKILLLATFGVTAGQGVIGMTSNFFSLQFMQAVLKINISTSSTVSAVALALSIPVYFGFGWLSDHVGRRKLMVSGLLLAAVFYLPIYMAMKFFSSPVNPYALCFLVWLQLLFNAMVVGPLMAFLTESFPAKVRTTSVTIPFNIGNGIIGGFMPFIALWLSGLTGNPFLGLAYPIGMALVTAVVNLTCLKETSGTRIWDEVEAVGGSAPHAEVKG
jgi:MFS family permease